MKALRNLAVLFSLLRGVEWLLAGGGEILMAAVPTGGAGLLGLPVILLVVIFIGAGLVGLFLVVYLRGQSRAVVVIGTPECSSIAITDHYESLGGSLLAAHATSAT